MHWKMEVSLITLGIFVFLPQSNSFESSDIRNYLGTRTPYRFIANKEVISIVYPQCVDKKIWMITRHGTRLPKASDINKFNTTLKNLKYEILLQHKLGKGFLNPEQLEKLGDWTTDLNEEEEKKLVYEGEVEMLNLAKRMKKRFPNAIRSKYNMDEFLFRYTATQRAQQSAVFFTIGLFNKKGSHDVRFAPATKVDPILRFYKHCDRWQKNIKKNPSTYAEKISFGQSLEMNSTLANISKVLGLNDPLPLDKADLIYKACGYETAWHEHWISPWCAVFNENTAKTMEYYETLKHYWQDSYGHELTYKQACLSIKNMFDSFVNDTGPRATFLFSHSGTLLKILTHLRLYKPEDHLRWNTVPEKRTWKTSEIDCFASNLAFILYRCEDEDYVLTLHQEKIIKLPGCEKELCPLKQLINYFHESIYNCDYSDMCSLN